MSRGGVFMSRKLLRSQEGSSNQDKAGLAWSTRATGGCGATGPTFLASGTFPKLAQSLCQSHFPESPLEMLSLLWGLQQKQTLVGLRANDFQLEPPYQFKVFDAISKFKLFASMLFLVIYKRICCVFYFLN